MTLRTAITTFLLTMMALLMPVAAYAAFGDASAADASRSAFFSNLALGVALTPVFIVLHELGHGLMALALGDRVVRITLGTGPRLGRIPLGWTELHVRAFPGNGFAHTAPAGGRVGRTRQWFVIAAGPAANAAICVIMYALIDRGPLGWSADGLEQQFDPVLVIYAINMMLALVNLVPMRIGCTRTDGLQLLAIPGATDGDLAQVAAEPQRLAAADASEEGRYADALACLDAALAIAPKSWDLRQARAVALTELGRMEVARLEFEELLRDKRVKGAVARITESNIAWCLAFGPDTAVVRERMDRLSEKAHKKLRRIPAVVGTRGSILVYLGQLSRGQKLLERALRWAPTRSSRAHHAAWLALAHTRAGDVARAEHYLAMARDLEPTNASLVRVEGLIETDDRLPGDDGSCAPSRADG